MDPNQNDPNSGNSTSNSNSYGAGSAPSIDSWHQNNENQTPAYNNTDYWNNSSDTKTQETLPNEAPVSETTSEAQTMESTTLTPDPVIPEENKAPEPENPPTNPWANYENQNSQTPETPNQNPWITTNTTEQTNPASAPEPTPSATENAPTSPISHPPKSSNALMIGMVALVLILLGSTGLFAFQNYQLKQQAKSTPTPQATTTPTPTPSSDPIADWNTYTNEKNKFEFKYPTETNLEIKKTITGEDYGNLAKGVSFIIDNQALEKCNGKACPTKTGTEKRGDYSFTKYTFHNDDPGGSDDFKPTDSVIYEYLLSTKQYVQISAVYISADTSEQSTVLDIFNNILSTFKDNAKQPSSSPVISNCSTGFEKFTNANFSFCYPTGMNKAAISTDTSVVLENTTETLKVVQNFQGGWGGSPCLTINAVQVAGYNSKRLSWKTEKTGGTGCETTFSSFATVVNEGVFRSPFPYMVEYTKKTGTFADDKNFLAIEASFDPAN